MISCYLLTPVAFYADDSVYENHLRSTYIGWTTKAWRRRRSHNREITAIVDGFVDQGLAM